MEERLVPEEGVKVSLECTGGGESSRRSSTDSTRTATPSLIQVQIGTRWDRQGNNNNNNNDLLQYQHQQQHTTTTTSNVTFSTSSLSCPNLSSRTPSPSMVDVGAAPYRDNRKKPFVMDYDVAGRLDRRHSPGSPLPLTWSANLYSTSLVQAPPSQNTQPSNQKDLNAPQHSRPPQHLPSYTSSHNTEELLSVPEDSNCSYRASVSVAPLSPVGVPEEPQVDFMRRHTLSSTHHHLPPHTLSSTHTLPPKDRELRRHSWTTPGTVHTNTNNTTPDTRRGSSVTLVVGSKNDASLSSPPHQHKKTSGAVEETKATSTPKSIHHTTPSQQTLLPPPPPPPPRRNLKYADHNIAYVVAGVYVGNLRAAYCEPVLCRLQIECVVDLSGLLPSQVPRHYHSLCPCTCPQSTPHHRSRLCIDLGDRPCGVEVNQVMGEVTSFLQAAIQRKKNALVHCVDGITTAPVVLAHYLNTVEEMPFIDALALVTSAYRPASRESQGMEANPKSHPDVASRESQSLEANPKSHPDVVSRESQGLEANPESHPDVVSRESQVLEANPKRHSDVQKRKVGVEKSNADAHKAENGGGLLTHIPAFDPSNERSHWGWEDKGEGGDEVLRERAMGVCGREL
ncbi:hypothetical protein Pcinc_039137 [Petrolisthes cinctipes]|uniref:Uncharacterized protein n=1 Tax=Petrolisthes cinctipes TaxID=88211 RepID=A0AAE1BSZ7_PETCI|nr:hypothetical protein Pcinc_039137 [Petrolisthes cinctipes]